MPDNNQRRAQEFAAYEAMDDDQLRQLLREDALKSQGEGMDVETLLYITQLLSQRRTKTGTGVSAQEALQRFRTYYDPEISQEDASSVTIEKQPRQIPWRRVLAPIAAVLALVLCCTFGKSAIGTDIWQVILNWTDETLQIDGSQVPPEPTVGWAYGEWTYESLTDALRAHGMDESIVPTWVPEDFSFYDARMMQDPEQRDFIAAYRGPRGLLQISVTVSKREPTTQHQQSDGWVEIYEVSGTPYFIFRNLSQTCAVWMRGELVCDISGPISVEEMKQIIDSIG